MSNLDKTGKKLIDSIRKTKKGPATEAVKSATKKTTTSQVAKPKTSSGTVKSKSKAATTKAKTAKVKATTKAPAKPKTKSKAKPKSSVAARKKQSRKKTTPLADIPYQDGSQVWPD